MLAVKEEGKTCTRCGVKRPTSEFYKDRTRVDGLYPQCRQCAAASKRKSLQKPENAAAQRASIARCRARKHVEYREVEEWARKRRKYGITRAQFEEMFQQQGGCCAICRQPETRRRLSIDHCHTTNRVRGLLCSECNTGIGKFRDDPARLRAAIDYLERVV